MNEIALLTLTITVHVVLWVIAGVVVDNSPHRSVRRSYALLMSAIAFSLGIILKTLTAASP